MTSYTQLVQFIPYTLARPPAAPSSVSQSITRTQPLNVLFICDLTGSRYSTGTWLEYVDLFWNVLSSTIYPRD